MKEFKKGINFIPEFMFHEKRRKERLIAVALGTAIVTLVCFAVYFIPQIKIFTLTTELENIDTETKFLSDLRDIKEKYQDYQSKVDTKRKIIEEVSKDDIDIIYLFDRLSSATPTNVIFSSLNIISRDSINVGYVVNNPIEATQLINRLRELKLFEKVELPNMPIMDKRTDISFTLKLKDGKVAGLQNNVLAKLEAVVPKQNVEKEATTVKESDITRTIETTSPKLGTNIQGKITVKDTVKSVSAVFEYYNSSKVVVSKSESITKSNFSNGSFNISTTIPNDKNIKYVRLKTYVLPGEIISYTSYVSVGSATTTTNSSSTTNKPANTTTNTTKNTVNQTTTTKTNTSTKSSTNTDTNVTKPNTTTGTTTPSTTNPTNPTKPSANNPTKPSTSTTTTTDQ